MSSSSARSPTRVIAISAPVRTSRSMPSARSASLTRSTPSATTCDVTPGQSQLTWGVATIVRVPAATAARHSSRLSASVSGPSSMPGSTWQCRSITD